MLFEVKHMTQGHVISKIFAIVKCFFATRLRSVYGLIGDASSTNKSLINHTARPVTGTFVSLKTFAQHL